VAFAEGAAETVAEGVATAPVVLLATVLLGGEVVAIGGAVMLVDYALSDRPAEAIANVISGTGSDDDYREAGGATVLIGGVVLGGAAGGLAEAELALADIQFGADMEAAVSSIRFGPEDVPGGWRVLAQAEADRAAARAAELHLVLDPIAQNGRTTAVLTTRTGPDYVGSGVRDIDPRQRLRLQLRPSEVETRFPGRHAEPTVFDGALEDSQQMVGLGASRDFCGRCIADIESRGGIVTGPRTAIFRPQE
jgi:hypothetical protein